MADNIPKIEIDGFDLIKAAVPHLVKYGFSDTHILVSYILTTGGFLVGLREPDIVEMIRTWADRAEAEEGEEPRNINNIIQNTLHVRNISMLLFEDLRKDLETFYEVEAGSFASVMMGFANKEEKEEKDGKKDNS